MPLLPQPPEGSAASPCRPSQRFKGAYGAEVPTSTSAVSPKLPRGDRRGVRPHRAPRSAKAPTTAMARSRRSEGGVGRYRSAHYLCGRHALSLRGPSHFAAEMVGELGRPTAHRLAVHSKTVRQFTTTTGRLAAVLRPPWPAVPAARARTTFVSPPRPSTGGRLPRWREEPPTVAQGPWSLRGRAGVGRPPVVRNEPPRLWLTASRWARRSARGRSQWGGRTMAQMRRPPGPCSSPATAKPMRALKARLRPLMVSR